MSRALIGPDASALDCILVVSKARNEQHGISGMLWYGNHNIAQVLEGDTEAVGDTIRRISKDSRHTDLTIIEDREISGRTFCGLDNDVR